MPGRLKHILQVCWGFWAEDPVGMVFNSCCQQRFNHILAVLGDIKPKWAMLKATLLCWLFETVVENVLVRVVVITPDLLVT